MNYPGKELEIFDKANIWRKYVYLLVKKFTLSSVGFIFVFF